MYCFIVLLCISSTWASPLVKPVPLKDVKGPRIINGFHAALGQFPWQAALSITGRVNSWFCGGAIIGEEWILTAAHCVTDVVQGVIYTGLVDLNAGGTFSEGVEFIPHERYNAETIENDIGLVKLRQPLTFNANIQAVALSEELLADGTDVTVSGWGVTDDGSASVSESLNYVNVTTINNRDCEDTYVEVSDDIVCATYKGDAVKSPCNGDSGGPAVINASTSPVHVAVVSFVSQDGCEIGYPSGYSRTAYFREWIRENTGV